MGASDRNTFEDVQGYTVREFGEAVLSLNKRLEAVLKCLFVFTWPNWHLGITAGASTTSENWARRATFRISWASRDVIPF